MTTHMWGDRWFWKNGRDLKEAMRYIRDYVQHNSHCYLGYKEKYGTMRFECIFPPGGSYYLKYGSMSQMWMNSWFYRRWERYGWNTAVKATKLAIEKWPHLEHELMEDLASNDWLVSKELHDKYWRSL